MKNNTIIYVARASNSKRDCKHDLHCCLLPRYEVLLTCRSEFPIATVYTDHKRLHFSEKIFHYVLQFHIFITVLRSVPLYSGSTIRYI